ncbi:MAG: winged helix-turn-helix domain-containing protein [Candidatus Thermoplasmatota archaeon]|nr:winged helix-turn-helix domain-containing protein [Candidatus Thermoplasmatota archaeon]
MIFANKRSESEIIAQILYSAEKETKKTQLLYKANISYKHFTKYFNFLLEKEFIKIKKQNNTTKIYQTTEKGEHFLKDINNVLQQIH